MMDIKGIMIFHLKEFSLNKYYQYVVVDHSRKILLAQNYGIIKNDSK